MLPWEQASSIANGEWQFLFPTQTREDTAATKKRKKEKRKGWAGWTGSRQLRGASSRSPSDARRGYEYQFARMLRTGAVGQDPAAAVPDQRGRWWSQLLLKTPNATTAVARNSNTINTGLGGGGPPATLKAYISPVCYLPALLLGKF
ncbi:hypothetical protein PG996_002811 [Apiospora saccharicola]|uniref:Uncharacterized protein n=1 Tax=Apiospora saccharicola TaxID=335842 RepID=A0ABR1WKI8_9PEZI